MIGTVGTIGILDMDMGNLRSVANAVHSLGFDPRLAKEPSELEGLTHLIVPGVGAYAHAMKRLEKSGMRSAIQAFAASGRPLLGICLGMQLLASEGDEGGPVPGLGLVPGRVARLAPPKGFAVPHVGWNNLEFLVPKHPVFDKIKSGVDFYFVHSYQFECADRADAYARTDYGSEFVSIAGRANVLGTQFHPEKSQANGLRMLENFCEWDGRC